MLVGTIKSVLHAALLKKIRTLKINVTQTHTCGAAKHFIYLFYNNNKKSHLQVTDWACERRTRERATGASLRTLIDSRAPQGQINTEVC